MTVGRLRLAGFLLVGALLVAAGYPFVSQVAGPIITTTLVNWLRVPSAYSAIR